MSDFTNTLTATEEGLVQLLYKFNSSASADSGKRLADIAQKLRLYPEQLLCAVGFNFRAKQLTEIFPLLGYTSFDAL